MSKLKIDMNPNTKSLIDFVNNLKVQDREILTRRPLTQYLHRRSKPRSIIGTTATSPIKRPQSAVFKRNEKRSLTPNDLRVKIYSTEKDENERKYKEYISQVKNVSDMIDGSPLLQEFDQILEFEKSLHKLLTQKIKNLNNLLSLLDYNYEIVNKPNSSNLLSRLLYAASNCNKIRPIKEDYLNKVIYEACSKSNDTQDIDLSFLRRVQDCEKCGNSFYLRKNERIFVCHDCKGEKIGPKFEGIGVILEINAKNKTFPKSPEEMMTKKNTYIDTMNTERSQSSRPISARKIKAKFSLRDLKEDLETSNLITISGYGRS